MKIITKNYKKNFVKAKIENLDDLWYLSYIVEKGDLVKARTIRKIKLGGDDDRNKKIIRKPVFIEIEVEKIEFSKYSNVLRVSGIIRQGPEDISLGSHHTINFEEGTVFGLKKQSFLNYQIEKLEDAEKELKHKILVVVHDREEAYFALVKKYGFEVLTKIKGSVQKKADVKTESADFFKQLKKTIEEYDKRNNFNNIIIASPGFWREYIKKLIKEDLKKKVVYATCSSVGENGINEVIKRDEVKAVLQQEKFAEEIKKVDELLSEISKQGKAEYGLKQIKKMVTAGAVSELLITDDLIHKKRQANKFENIERMMRTVETSRGKVHIITSEHDGGKKLDGLGGIGALLRYKLNY